MKSGHHRAAIPGGRTVGARQRSHPGQLGGGRDDRTGGRAAAGPSADKLQRGESSPQATSEPRVGCEQPPLKTLLDRRPGPRQTGGQERPQQEGQRDHRPSENWPLNHAEGVPAPDRTGGRSGLPRLRRQRTRGGRDPPTDVVPGRSPSG